MRASNDMRAAVITGWSALSHRRIDSLRMMLVCGMHRTIVRSATRRAAYPARILFNLVSDQRLRDGCSIENRLFCTEAISSHVHATARIHPSATIGPFSVIADGVQVQDSASMYLLSRPVKAELYTRCRAMYRYILTRPSPPPDADRGRNNYREWLRSWSECHDRIELPD